MDPAIDALLDFVNGKNITGEQFLLIVNGGYIRLTDKALIQLQELKGAVHPLNGQTNADQPL